MTYEDYKQFQQATSTPEGFTSAAHFKDGIWGNLPKLCLPSCIVDKKSNAISLDNETLNVLIAVLCIQRDETLKHRSTPEGATAIVKADRKALMQITGMSKNLVSNGLKSLEEAGYIAKIRGRDKLEQFAATQCILLNPITHSELLTHSDSKLLHANGLHYFTIPACIFGKQSNKTPATSAFVAMTNQERRLYIALTWLATQNKSSEFATTGTQLKTLTGLPDRAFKKSLEGLETKKLVWNSDSARTLHNLTIILRNPLTEELIGENRFDRNSRNNRENWYSNNPKGGLKKADFRLSSKDAETLFLEFLGERGESAQREGNEEFKFCCPFHADSTPSCNFNPTKGCFHCFAKQCNERGTTYKLLKKLSGGNGQEAIKRIARAKGMEIEYSDPDSKAVAVYNYIDQFQTLKKQVLRLPNDDAGNRQFRQRSLAPFGWIYKTSGVKPILFNRWFIEFADTVLITEGEKDAVTVTELALQGRNGMAFGTTSGGADSWNPVLAKDLRCRRVVILPDNDEAGKRYADEVEESLRAEGIEYRRASFHGTGAKDVTEYMETHSTEDLVRLIGVDWVRVPDGGTLFAPCNESAMMAGRSLACASIGV